ncbi:MAG: ion channel [Acetobacteraceae bacterium]
MQVHRRSTRHRGEPLAPFSAEALRRIERRGLARHGFSDLFHELMTMRLSALLGLMAGTVVLINLGFGAIYTAIGGIAGARPGDFGDGVFFSVQTFSTTGYGALYPKSMLANSVASIEIICGLLATALATGLLFARLSRPQARVMFSRVAVVHPYQGVPTLMFRIANRRRNLLTDARISVTLMRDEEDEDGNSMRRMIDLPLERDHSPAFAISWTVMHRITETSPLFGIDQAAMRAGNMILLCVLTGLDDTLLATVFARHVYGADECRFGMRFADIFDRAPGGDFTINFARFHDVTD